jgi:hypothetical protein
LHELICALFLFCSARKLSADETMWVTVSVSRAASPFSLSCFLRKTSQFANPLYDTQPFLGGIQSDYQDVETESPYYAQTTTADGGYMEPSAGIGLGGEPRTVIGNPTYDSQA